MASGSGSSQDAKALGANRLALCHQLTPDFSYSSFSFHPSHQNPINSGHIMNRRYSFTPSKPPQILSSQGFLKPLCRSRRLGNRRVFLPVHFCAFQEIVKGPLHLWSWSAKSLESLVPKCYINNNKRFLYSLFSCSYLF